MTEWTDVMLIALGSQLAVLPGEKVQFLIAGLSTRCNPYLVVAAAGSAFAGWTTLEILFGGALQRVLPELYLDLLTGALFLLFAAMPYRSAPREGLDDARPPNDHGAASAIWVGEMIAIVPVSLANALLFHRFAHRVDLRKAHYAGAGIFAFFALDILLSVTAGVSLWGTAVQTVSSALPEVA